MVPLLFSSVSTHGCGQLASQLGTAWPRMDLPTHMSDAHTHCRLWYLESPSMDSHVIAG